MKYNVRKSFYGSVLLEIDAETEEDAIRIGENTIIDLDENLGDIKCEIQND